MIRKSQPWLCVLVCVVWSSAAAASASHPDASQTITSAEQAIREHGFSAGRLFALGQAQIEHDRVGAAIASFERGLVLAPRDATLRTALAQARERAGLPPTEFESPVSHFAHQLSLREWAFGAFGSVLLASVALIGWSLRWRRGWFVALFVFAAFSAACTLSGAMITRKDLQRAYVLGSDSAVRQSPFAAASALTNLHAGESVKQLDHHADYIYVETEEGIFGWMARDGLAPLAADRS